MPTFNMTPILFPKPRKNEIYDMLKDLIDIKMKEKALIEGGEFQNPNSLEEFIEIYETMEKDSRLTAGQRREATKKKLDLQKQQIKIWLDRKKEIDKSGIEWALTQDLREIEFVSPEDPWVYSIEAYKKIQDLLYGTEDADGLNDILPVLKAHNVDTTTLEKYRDFLAIEELEKFSRIDRAFSEGNLDELEEYAVLYTPHVGKVARMEIIDRGQIQRSHMQKTNLKFSVDEKKKLITLPADQKGMPIYFIKANAATGDVYNFAGAEFEFTSGIGFEMEKPELFNYQKIRHSTMGDIPPGNFVKDSRGKLYYINQDWTYTPIKQEKFKEELGFQEDKVYHLNPLEELNTLPGAIEHKLPLPILERFNREAETSKFNFWQAFKEEIPKAIPKVLGFPERVIPTLPIRIREFHREAIRRAEERRKIEKPIPEELKWELPGLKIPPLIKRGKEFIKKITPTIPK